MSCRPILRDVPQQTQSETSGTTRHFLPNGEPRPADVEMARVLKTAPVSMASDPASGAIAHWKHGALHDVVKPMADHVIMTYPSGVQRLERRNGKSAAIGTARSGVVTLERVAGEADTLVPGELLERTGYPDPTTSRLLISASDAIQGSAALDALFRHQLNDLLATRLLAAHAGAPAVFQPTLGGLAPTALRRAIERLHSDHDTDVSLAALASDAGLSRFHFCRAFKESTGLSPHAWLRQHRLEQAMKMLRETDDPVVSIAAALGYSSQTAFAAAFRKLTGETPSDWRRRTR